MGSLSRFSSSSFSLFSSSLYFTPPRIRASRDDALDFRAQNLARYNTLAVCVDHIHGDHARTGTRPPLSPVGFRTHKIWRPWTLTGLLDSAGRTLCNAHSSE